VIRLFNVYYPVRTLFLLVGEATIVYLSFLLATVIRFGPDAYLELNYQHGLTKILAVTLGVLFCAYAFDLYAPQQLNSKAEIYVRIMFVLGLLSLVLSCLGYLLPQLLLGKSAYALGLVILTLSLPVWRTAYQWLLAQPLFRQRVYVLGSGDRARRVVEALRTRADLGMDVVGWTGGEDGSTTREQLASAAKKVRQHRLADQVIVAMSDRRGLLPVRELLDVRLSGIVVQDANVLLEKIGGKIEIDGLTPSVMIFADGFRQDARLLFVRRIVSTLLSLTILLCCLPLIPIIALAIKLTSPGPVLFRQERVGRNGVFFTLYKFRTMRQDAEAGTGPTWAASDDPRITTLGKFLRISRLDEIPQLWNVLKGDMGFVGPRPERPEFVQWLNEAIPYYQLRHIIRPGITGWAQVRYQYGATLEETKRKLEYDLYYIKHMSLALDMLIAIETVKTVLRARGR